MQNRARNLEALLVGGKEVAALVCCVALEELARVPSVEASLVFVLQLGAFFANAFHLGPGLQVGWWISLFYCL